MDTNQKALYYFRKLVYCLYREIGVLLPRNHREIAAKARLDSGFFKGERKKQASALYHLTEDEENTGVILKPYEERTGLLLEDIHRAFAEGDWRNSCGSYSFGGPKWASIAKKVLELRRVIDNQDWGTVDSLIREIDTLEHNTGLITEKFGQTEWY